MQKMNVSKAVLPVLSEEVGKMMLSKKSTVNEEYLKECLELMSKFTMIKK